jgi:selenide,water dikinase
MTDITGFGIAGHLVEMSEGSGLSAILHYAKIPKLKGLNQYLDKNIIPDATYRNWNSFSEKIKIESSVNMMEGFRLLPDPQTNGELLISVAPEGLAEIQKLLSENGYGEFIEPIGQFESKGEKVVTVK